uniref:Uncharacterized protein n=1 Tax=Anopheles culicifacies TaxID=139723 RepID=A0A182MHD9_9DIPT
MSRYHDSSCEYCVSSVGRRAVARASTEPVPVGSTVGGPGPVPYADPYSCTQESLISSWVSRSCRWTWGAKRCTAMAGGKRGSVEDMDSGPPTAPLVPPLVPLAEATATEADASEAATEDETFEIPAGIGCCALLTITVLISSVTLKCIYRNRQDAAIPDDFQDLIDYGWFDFTGDIVHLISIGVLFYGIKKASDENRFCLIPFLISIVFDWIAYLITNTRNGTALPYQVWLVTTALFLYVFVTLIGLYKCFQIKLKEGGNRSDEFNETMCL